MYIKKKTKKEEDIGKSSSFFYLLCERLYYFDSEFLKPLYKPKEIKGITPK